ncbi:hypothetical protein DFJ73DRAFT_811609 [Zopfochytrium polystomum]|nr:hypothetical protein DFJ73DRAFT_811609 [Zopfochytrium polystomum]
MGVIRVSDVASCSFSELLEILKASAEGNSIEIVPPTSPPTLAPPTPRPDDLPGHPSKQPKPALQDGCQTPALAASHSDVPSNVGLSELSSSSTSEGGDMDIDSGESSAASPTEPSAKNALVDPAHRIQGNGSCSVSDVVVQEKSNIQANESVEDNLANDPQESEQSTTDGSWANLKSALDNKLNDSKSTLAEMESELNEVEDRLATLHAAYLDLQEKADDAVKAAREGWLVYVECYEKRSVVFEARSKLKAKVAAMEEVHSWHESSIASSLPMVPLSISGGLDAGASPNAAYPPTPVTTASAPQPSPRTRNGTLVATSSSNQSPVTSSGPGESSGLKQIKLEAEPDQHTATSKTTEPNGSTKLQQSKPSATRADISKGPAVAKNGSIKREGNVTVVPATTSGTRKPEPEPAPIATRSLNAYRPGMKRSRSRSRNRSRAYSRGSSYSRSRSSSRSRSRSRSRARRFYRYERSISPPRGKRRLGSSPSRFHHPSQRSRFSPPLRGRDRSSSWGQYRRTRGRSRSLSMSPLAQGRRPSNAPRRSRSRSRSRPPPRATVPERSNGSNPKLSAPETKNKSTASANANLPPKPSEPTPKPAEVNRSKAAPNLPQKPPPASTGTTMGVSTATIPGAGTGLPCCRPYNRGLACAADSGKEAKCPNLHKCFYCGASHPFIKCNFKGKIKVSCIAWNIDEACVNCDPSSHRCIICMSSAHKMYRCPVVVPTTTQAPITVKANNNNNININNGKGQDKPRTVGAGDYCLFFNSGPKDPCRNCMGAIRVSTYGNAPKVAAIPSGSSCRLGHHCLRCGSGGHPSVACPNNVRAFEQEIMGGALPQLQLRQLGSVAPTATAPGAGVVGVGGATVGFF